MPSAHSEEVHMGFWGDQWHVVRQQQLDSAHAEFRAPAQFIASTSNFPWALQLAFNTLPNNPSGSATRSLLRVRHTRTWTNSEHAYHINSEVFGHTLLRNKNNVTIDFEDNQFVTDGGNGAFLNAGSLQGLTIKNLTVHSRPAHTGAHVINLMGTHNSTIENFRCYRNGNGGIGVRADGKQGQWWMWNLLIHGDLQFSGGAGGKFAIETMTVNNLQIGEVTISHSPGGICVNNGANTGIHRVNAHGVSPGGINNYAAVRFANDCVSNYGVGSIIASNCGRALATVTSPNLSMNVGYVQAIDCTELGIRLNGGNGIRINAAYIQGGAPYGGIDFSGDMQNTLIRNFTIKETTGHGVNLAGTKNQLFSGTVEGCRRAGILVNGGYGNRVSFCTVTKNGSGVGLGGNSTVLEHSSIYHNNGLGIEVTGRPIGIDHVNSWQNAWNGSFFNGSRDRTGAAYVTNSSIDWR